MSDPLTDGKAASTSQSNPPAGKLALLMARWKNWIPAGIWMLLIFTGSSDLLSSRNTFGMLNPLLRWFCPTISARTVQKIHHFVRKAGHVSEYAILAILLWRAMPDYSDVQKPLWKRRKAALVLAAAVFYASSDELHQTFVRSRTGAFGDVGFDSCGAVVGLVVAWAWDRRRFRLKARLAAV
jgi:VanZ family protein